MNMKLFKQLAQLILLSVTLASAPAFAESDQQSDPWEGFNRAMFNFNDALDRAIVKPVAQGYRYVMPDIAERGVHNFFENLGDVVTMVNNLLQLKPVEAVQDLSRVVINTTIGIGGLIDVASAMDIPKHDEDFGQTLGAWGLDSGPYLVLPLLGPSSLRDGVGRIPDSMIDPINQVTDDEVRTALWVGKVIDKRADLLKREGVITGDRYIFIRDAYLQKREFDVNDGQIPFKSSDF